MKRNRVRKLNRWPKDPHKRYDLALADIGFCRAITKIMGNSTKELDRIHIKALEILKLYEEELEANE